MAKKPTEALPRSLDVEAEPTLYNRNSLTQALGVSYYHKIIIGIWKTIARQQAVGAAAGIVTVGGEPVQWRMMRSLTTTVPYLPASALPAFRAAIGASPDKGPGNAS